MLISPWPVKPGAGVNNVILGLSAAMQCKYEPVIAIAGWDPPVPGQIPLRLLPPALPIRNLLAFILYFVPRLIRLRRLVRGAVAVNPHYPGLTSLHLVPLRKANLCPTLILSVHGSEVRDMLAKSWVYRRMYDFLLSNADVVIACSRGLAEEVREISPGAKVVTIWNAADPPPSVIGDRPMKAPYLLCIGQFARKKGIDVLLHAFKRIAEVRSDLNLTLIGGNGPERETFAAMIRELGLPDKVQMMLNVPHEQVWRWLRHAECMILPSREESFGICLLEAGLVRTPVVATRVGGIPEFVVDGVHGLLCDPEQPGDLAQAILKTITDRVSAEARAEAFFKQASSLTWDRAFESYCRAAALQ